MKIEHENDKALLKAINALPREMEPGRDIWPEISGRLEPHDAPRAAARTAWKAWAMAAMLVLTFSIGVLLGRQSGSQPVIESAGPGSMYPALAVALDGAEREYVAAFKGFSPIGVGSTLLSQEATQDIERSWEQLMQAETALLAAMEQHPENPFLGEKLIDLRTQQLEFIRQLHMLDQNSRRSI